MNFVKEARILVNYVHGLDDFKYYEIESSQTYSHVGALFTDIILQAGLNYRSIVKPRVNMLMQRYPDASTTFLFSKLIEQKGLENIISWSHPTKLNRIKLLVDYSLDRGIDTCDDWAFYLRTRANQLEFLNLNGIGPKTLDYTMKLLSFDTIAVDRHIISFLNRAGINVVEYYSAKKIVEFAADLMNISRRNIDCSIWEYMSASIDQRSRQLEMFTF
jgi:hypothetical protein